MYWRNDGQPVHRADMELDDLMLVLAGNHRLDLLRAVADGPKPVSAISDQVFLSLPAVSRGLSHLQRHGLVQWTRRKNHHIYRLSDAARAFKRGGAVQISARIPVGMVFLHLDEGDQPRPLGLPESYVESLTPLRADPPLEE